MDNKLVCPGLYKQSCKDLSTVETPIPVAVIIERNGYLIDATQEQLRRQMHTTAVEPLMLLAINIKVAVANGHSGIFVKG